MEEKTINLYYSNESTYVWDANDWMTLRSKHRIVGELVGALASHPRNEGTPGMPMMLMDEEVHLLVKKGYAQLRECSKLCDQPSENRQKEYAKLKQEIYLEQVECMKQKRIDQISCRIDIIIAGKRRKMASQGVYSEFEREKVLKEEIDKIVPLPEGNSLVQIPTKHPWPLESQVLPLSVLKITDDSERGALKLAVFEDLWEKGYYVTCGIKFGGDFLVYPGDPVKYHAMYVVKCLKDSQIDVETTNLVAFGRLGVSVNKLNVFAFLSEKNTVIYQTLRWYEALPENT